jgi:uncharacterized membrane protein YphA (DoxX/SURF4 family)
MSPAHFIPIPEQVDQAARARLLPYVILYLRLSMGLWLLNGGLAQVMPGNGRAGGPLNRFNLNGKIPGTEPITQLLPYVELGVGVALILGIFTTIAALTACAMSLVVPLLTSITLVAQVGVNNPFANPFELAGMFVNQSTLSYALLVYLSPSGTNRFSIDALIFRPPVQRVAEEVDPKESDAEP